MVEANIRPLPVTTSISPSPKTLPQREDSSSTTTSSFSASAMGQTTTSTSTQVTTLEHSMLGLKLTSSPPPSDAQQYKAQITSSSPSFSYSSPSGTPSPTSARNTSLNGAPALTAELPTIGALQDALPLITLPSTPLDSQVAWIRDILYLVNRACSVSPSSSSDSLGPAIIDEPALAELAEAAVSLLLVITPTQVVSGSKLPAAMAEALFHRAALTSSGAFPALIPQNPRVAFRTFEAAARAGYQYVPLLFLFLLTLSSDE